jgi:hypothetical protein
MKITILLVAVLLLTVQDSRDTFWQQFKEAVNDKNVDIIATLSQFPIEMPYGIGSIKTKADLRRRYRRVFNEQTNAATCFSKAKPELDPENAKHFYVVCPDAAGNETIMYHFTQTKTGWKFTGLDNINE